MKRKIVFLILLAAILSLFGSVAWADVVVSYDANGGISAPGDIVVVPFKKGLLQFKHPDFVPKREGYRFIGWLEGNDPVLHARTDPGDRIVLDGSSDRVVYYAQWLPTNGPALAPILSMEVMPDRALRRDISTIDWLCVQDAPYTQWGVIVWDSAVSQSSAGDGLSGFISGNGRRCVFMTFIDEDGVGSTVEYVLGGEVGSKLFLNYDTKTFPRLVCADYPWEQGQWYTMRVQARTEGDKTVFEQWVRPSGGEWEKTIALSYPLRDLGMDRHILTVIDQAGSNLPRSCLVRNVYGRDQASGNWISETDWYLSALLVRGYDLSQGYDLVPANCDCDARLVNAGTLWLQTGGAGYEDKTTLPKVLTGSFIQPRQPVGASLLK